MHFLNLIRWKNLLIIALAQLLVKYALLIPFNAEIMLNWFGTALLVAATLCLASAGYIINDILDVETDMVNRPEKVLIGKKITEKNAYNWFIALNVIGILIGFYLSYLVGKNQFFSLFVLVSALLYIYSSYLKQMVLVGNVIISLVVGLSILIVGFFELIPAIDAQNRASQLFFFQILTDYALFAFTINLVRELAKDIEDIDGDHKAGMNTLPIAIGRDRSRKVLFAVSLLPLGGTIYYVTTYLYKQPVAVVYFLLCIIAPLLYISIKAFSAKTKKDFRNISNLLKLVMLTGILSLLLYPFILK
ncbi:MAG TPA: geranylgeranylglycerol-phosphate geranylgeranyltransferase [Aquaticitalea sp.]|nr:geranylgeranylglycerol-phosphate geranylgeranyltransferase [Aquaticitalea sp.]HNU58909.1 geranylgeranylglycerol-phosphate geranylgeranyltransferase [Aquaticitalea sp.]